MKKKENFCTQFFKAYVILSGHTRALSWIPVFLILP